MNSVLIFGAGATKACGGPLTNEILPDAFRIKDKIERENFLHIVNEFLVSRFNVPKDIEERKNEDYPPLPLLLALLDTAIDKKHAFDKYWPLNKLVHVREGLEYLIFALLEYQLSRSQGHNHYHDLFKVANEEWRLPEINVISTNYDIIADNSMIGINDTFPDYGTDIATDFYRSRPKRGQLLKLHGSLNWLYCPGCHRLDLGLSQSGSRTVKVLNALYRMEYSLEQRYSIRGSECEECGSSVRPVMITPTRMKDYRNPHISNVWYRAERMLRRADKVIIIGYSLPEDDVDVIYLLKRGLGHLDPKKITVVEYDKDEKSLHEHPVGKRYRSIFGYRIGWYTRGFEQWIRDKASII